MSNNLKKIQTALYTRGLEEIIEMWKDTILAHLDSIKPVCMKAHKYSNSTKMAEKSKIS